MGRLRSLLDLPPVRQPGRPDGERDSELFAKNNRLAPQVRTCIATGIAVMGSSKPGGIGLLGAGGYCAWDGYQEKKEAERRLQWGFLVQMDRETKAVACHMSW